MDYECELNSAAIPTACWGNGFHWARGRPDRRSGVIGARGEIVNIMPDEIRGLIPEAGVGFRNAMDQTESRP
jgi:hypothetical protein